MRPIGIDLFPGVGEVIHALGVTPIRPKAVISLADPDVPSFNLSIFSKYFGVEPPPSRSDRKSGARKRTQIAIEREHPGDAGETP